MTELKNDMIINGQNEQIRVYPMIALRGKVLFPKTMLNFDVGRPMSIEAINRAVQDNSCIFIAPQKSVFVQTPKKSDVLNSVIFARKSASTLTFILFEP